MCSRRELGPGISFMDSKLALLRLDEEKRLFHRLKEALSVNAIESLLERVSLRNASSDPNGLESMKVTRKTFPRVFEQFQDTCERLGIDEVGRPECFISTCNKGAKIIVTQSPEKGESTSTKLILDYAVPERLTDSELRAVMAHELAHFVFGHWSLRQCFSLIGLDKKGERVFALVKLFEYWQGLSELSADRASLLVVDHVCDAVSSLFKVKMPGLPKEFNLRAHLEHGESWLKEVQEDGFVLGCAYPPLNLRALALYRCGQSEFLKALREKGGEGLHRVDHKNLDGFTLPFRNHPLCGAKEVEYLFLLVAGHFIVNSDGCRHHSELTALTNVLSRLVIDPPASIKDASSKDLKEHLIPLGKNIASKYPHLKEHLYSVLASLVIEDGRITEDEIRALDEVAEALELHPSIAATILLAKISQELLPIIPDYAIGEFTQDSRREG